MPLESVTSANIAETRARSSAHNAHASDNGAQHSTSQHPVTTTSAEAAPLLADSGERSDGEPIAAGRRVGSNTVGALSADRRTESDHGRLRAQQEREAERRKQRKLLETWDTIADCSTYWSAHGCSCTSRRRTPTVFAPKPTQRDHRHDNNSTSLLPPRATMPALPVAHLPALPPSNLQHIRP